MAFKGLPRSGTVIPEHYRREPTSINSQLHELPAYREHTYDLVGTVLYLPRTRWVVVPFRADGGCQIIHGDDTYRPTGYHVMITEWELQRALRVVLDLRSVQADFEPLPRIGMEQTADGHWIKVLRETPIVVEPEPGARSEDWTERNQVARIAEPRLFHDPLSGPFVQPGCLRCGFPLSGQAVLTAQGWTCLDRAICDRRTKESEKTP